MRARHDSAIVKNLTGIFKNAYSPGDDVSLVCGAQAPSTGMRAAMKRRCDAQQVDLAILVPQKSGRALKRRRSAR